MPQNFITNTGRAVAQDPPGDADGHSQTLKFLVGFFYFSGWY